MDPPLPQDIILFPPKMASTIKSPAFSMSLKFLSSDKNIFKTLSACSK
jgi:hypothetical protein